MRVKQYWDNEYTIQEVNYLKRAYLELEDKNFADANYAAESCLGFNVENADAWLVKFLIDFEYKSLDSLQKISSQYTLEKITNNVNFKKVLRFANDSLTEEINAILQSIKSSISKQKDLVKQKDYSYINYLKEELAKMGIGERILALKKKRTNTSTKISMLVYPIIVLSCLGIALIYGLDFVIELYKEPFTKADLGALMLFYGVLAGVFSYAITIAVEIVSVFLSPLVRKEKFSRKIDLGLLTKDQFLKGEKSSRRGDLADLKKVNDYILDSKYKNELLYINHRNY